MAEWHTTASLEAVAESVVDSTAVFNLDSQESAITASIIAIADSTAITATLESTVLFEADSEVWIGLVSSNQGAFTFKFSGELLVEKKLLPVYGTPVGTVNNIEDLPVSAADGTVYNVLGTADNRESIAAVYSTLSSKWLYQPNTWGRTTTSITRVNPLIGTNVTMPNYINFNGVPHTPKYWSTTTISSTFDYYLEQIETTSNPAVPPTPPGGGPTSTIWKWRVQDLPDPGSGSISLNEWWETSGTGPKFYSKSWYRPQIKNSTKFNISKNKTRKQRCVAFNNSNVDHMWMEIPGGWNQPFTVIFVGVIQQYPNAKFGHYLLDAGGELPVYKLAATQGKDYFPNENKTPRNGMLVYRRHGRMGCDDFFSSGPNITIKHNEKPRPRMWFGVFNGSNSSFGFMDTKYKEYKTGTVGNYGAHRYFVVGRRTNRISDNRASKFQLWEINMINRALTKAEIDGLYQEMANKYQFKKYT